MGNVDAFRIPNYIKRGKNGFGSECQNAIAEMAINYSAEIYIITVITFFTNLT